MTEFTNTDTTTPYNQLKRGGGNENSGRHKNCGLSVIEHLNHFAANNLTESDVRAIQRDKKIPGDRRIAAVQYLRAMQDGDLADFEPLLDGQMSMRELRAQGVPTNLLKKCKTKTRTLPATGEVEVEREIELHDHAGDAFDKVLDRTHGKPAQEIQLDVSSVPPLIMVVSPRTRQIATNSQLGENSAYTEALGATDET